MNQMLLRLGHSPDPDDAFMFYGLARNRIATGRYRFEHVLQDIQTLNQRATRGDLEITAISIHAYPYVADKYALTSCGSSMGDKYGPMVVSKTAGTLADLRGKTIAIPGTLTTAFLALQLALGKGVAAEEGSGFGVQGSADAAANPQIENRKSKIENPPAAPATAPQAARTPEPRSLNPEPFYYQILPFDQILKHVKDGKADAGLIIHEGQLTYKQLGLRLVVDLGAWWHEQTQLPLPLGGNCIRKDLGPQVMQEVTDILKKSIQYSLDHRAEAVEYALQFGRDLDRSLADRFVGMYVNKWTLDYGPIGRQAISLLLKKGSDAGLVPPIANIEYVTAV